MRAIVKMSIILLFFSGCKTESNKENITREKAFKVSYDRTSNLGAIQKRLFINAGNIIFKDEKYIVTSYDFGEWGGYIEFKDSITKHRYVYPASTIYQMGKVGNDYIVFSHSGHSGIGSIMQLKPGELYKLPDTSKVFTKQVKDNIAQYFVTSKNKGILTYTDEKDSLFTVVGMFISKGNTYAVQSNWFFAKNDKEHRNTVISSIDLVNGKYQVIDTILKDRIHTSGVKGVTSLNVPEQIVRYEMLSTNTDKIKQGGIILKGDSLIIVEQ